MNKPIDEIALRVFSELFGDPDVETEITDYLKTEFNDVGFLAKHLQYGCPECREIFNITSQAEIDRPEAQKYLVERCSLNPDALQEAAGRFELLKREMDSATLQ